MSSSKGQKAGAAGFGGEGYTNATQRMDGYVATRINKFNLFFFCKFSHIKAFSEIFKHTKFTKQQQQQHREGTEQPIPIL